MAKEYKDDSLLIEACIKRDSEAWSYFLNKYSPLIAIAAENRLKKHALVLGRQDIEDIRQDVLSSIWDGRRLEGVRNRADISCWIAVVAGNAAISYVRKNLRRFPIQPVSLFESINEKTLADLIPSEAPGPVDEAAKKEISERIGAIIRELPDKERLIVKLDLFYGKKYHEIAEILHLPKGTVSSYIKRAKERLRRRLKEFL